jgi:hypothetical protein
MANSSLGLRIGIPPEIAQKLREESIHQFQGVTAELSSPLAISSEDQKSRHTTKESITDALPGIRINLKKLVGYQPSDDEEIQSIQLQLIEAMWARYHQQQPTLDEVLPVHQQQQEEQSSPPPDFDAQVIELFESGLAQYCDDPSNPHHAGDDDSYLVLRYPTYLQSPETGEPILTISLVKELRKIPSLDFLQKLWTYLEGCSRTLFWKRNMAVELSHLIREEQARLDYQEWTESKRQAKLDNLYSIRETLVHQVEMAKANVDVMEEEREDQVKVAMEPIQRKILQRQPDSLNAFGTSELSFPDEFQWLGLRDEEPLDGENDWGHSSKSSVDDDDDDFDRSIDDDVHDDETNPEDESSADESSADESGNDGEREVRTVEGLAALGTVSKTHFSPPMDASQPTHEDVVIDLESNTNNGTECAEEGNEAVLLLPFQRRKKRMEKAKRRKKENRRITERKAREEQLMKLESELRTKLTSKELILAQTMHNALAEKMTKIEELLDSLQDEVWQAEEEAEATNAKNRPNDQDADSAFSLLDQVLAMILGATPNVGEKEPKEHYLGMQLEHRRIVEAWKAHFGRLPPPAGFMAGSAQSNHQSPPLPEDRMTSKEQRQRLGLTENDDDDWEALDSLLNVGDAENPTLRPSDSGVVPTKPQPTPKRQEEPSAPRLVGLRPGGRIVRPSS